MVKVENSELADTVLRHQIVEPASAQIVHRLAHRFSNPRELAGALIRAGLATPFQINQVFRGKEAELRMGRYVLLERLGEGGMGQVFKARQINLGRIVALKVIHQRMLDNPKAISRFQREIESAGQLSHPNIVHAFDADEVDGTYFFAMEFVEGIDLAKLILESGPLLVPQACDFVRQTALGLQHAHSCGMVHRDIKPANLLVTREREVQGPSASAFLVRAGKGPYPWGMIKILDMGLARWRKVGAFTTRSTITQLGALMGTPDYIAPEQARDSRNSDIRSDIYSLGCTLYFLLTGQPPFPKGNVTEKLLQHQLDKPASIQKTRYRRLTHRSKKERKTNSSAMAIVPRKVSEIVARMMAKHPKDRYQTPAELAKALAIFAPPTNVR